jgi:hypothetical protein
MQSFQASMPMAAFDPKRTDCFRAIAGIRLQASGLPQLFASLRGGAMADFRLRRDESEARKVR